SRRNSSSGEVPWPVVWRSVLISIVSELPVSELPVASCEPGRSSTGNWQLGTQKLLWCELVAEELVVDGALFEIGPLGFEQPVAEGVDAAGEDGLVGPPGPEGGGPHGGLPVLPAGAPGPVDLPH